MSLVKSNLFWIWEVDENFKFTKSNSLIEKYLGYSNSEILGKNFLEIISKSNIIKIMELIHKRANKEIPISFNMLFSHKNGNKLKFKTNCSCIINNQNHVIGLQGISRIENNDSENELNKEIKKLTKLNNVKDLIIDEISYDIRNPAHIILSLSQMLHNENLSSKYIPFLTNNARTISKVLDIAHNYSDMLNGTEVKNERILLKELVDDSLVNNKNLSACKINITYKFNSSFDIYTTPLISEILKTYISKIACGLDGNLEIIIEATKVNGDKIIKIIDLGTTIPKDERNTFFKKSLKILETVDQETIFGAEIGKKLLEMNNGKIWIESNKPSGNCLYIQIPDNPIL